MNYKEIFENSYKGKRVLLTGHTGFKGSWLLIWLQRLGAQVKGFALAPEHGNDLYCLINGDSLCDSTLADICDKNALQQTVLQFEPDVIFHLAAQPLVRRSYKNPAYTFEANTLGTLYLLDAVRQLSKPCAVVVVTTDKVYENKEIDYPYQEADKLGGYDPYSASKAAAEIVISSYRNSFFNPAAFSTHLKSIASARAGNVIGGGDRSEDRIVPDIIRAFETNQPVTVRNPSAVRPWQHVLEPLAGYLLLGSLMQKDPARYSDSWNFGPYNDDVLTVKEVVEHAINEWGSGSFVTPQLAGQPHEAGLLKLDISKSIKGLNWKPRMDSAMAIHKTIGWYRQAASVGAYQLVLDQIEEYETAE